MGREGFRKHAVRHHFARLRIVCVSAGAKDGLKLGFIPGGAFQQPDNNALNEWETTDARRIDLFDFDSQYEYRISRSTGDARGRGAAERNPPAFQGGHREYRGFGLERPGNRLV
jgi:hypothetical protein